jgi:hypothetical protein
MTHTIPHVTDTLPTSKLSPDVERYKQAFKELEMPDKISIDNICALFQEVPGMGVVTSFELAGKLGEWIVEWCETHPRDRKIIYGPGQDKDVP